MTTDLDSYVLTDGNVLELYEPPASGQGGMQAGKCPGCHNGLRDYRGRCACIRELEIGTGQPLIGQYTTSYGHYDCVAELYRSLVHALKTTSLKTPAIWKYGTQREMVLYVQGRGLENKAVVVEYDEDAERSRKYRFRTTIEGDK